MSNKLTSCPVCDGTSIHRKEIEEKISVPFGPEKTVKQYIHVCNNCGFEMDDSETNDTIVTQALDESRKEAVVKILDELSAEGHSLAGIERALGLPQRTMSRWKNSTDLSSGGFSLLQIIRTYPWIIDVADMRYERSFAAQMLIRQAANVLGTLVLSANMNISAGIKYDALSEPSGLFFSAERPVSSPGTIVETEVINEVA